MIKSVFSLFVCLCDIFYCKDLNLSHLQRVEEKQYAFQNGSSIAPFFLLFFFALSLHSNEACPFSFQKVILGTWMLVILRPKVKWLTQSRFLVSWWVALSPCHNTYKLCNCNSNSTRRNAHFIHWRCLCMCVGVCASLERWIFWHEGRLVFGETW